MKITAKEMIYIIHSVKAQVKRVKSNEIRIAEMRYPKEKDLPKLTELWENNLAKNREYNELIALYEKLSGSEIDLEVE